MTSSTPDSSAPTAVLAEVYTATASLLTSVKSLQDSDIGEPSLLPGWTRGHVLAHLARNADSLVNLLLWARTGIETPQYASDLLRESDIENGSARAHAEQLDDLRSACERFQGLAVAMPEDRWDFRVKSRQGTEFRAAKLPWLRLREVEIHHVDLNIGYLPEQWPAPFVARMLSEVVKGMNRSVDHRPADAKPMTTDPNHPSTPNLTLTATDTEFTATIGPEPADTVSGTAAEILAWLIGRSDGVGLTGFLPNLPAWL